MLVLGWGALSYERGTPVVGWCNPVIGQRVPDIPQRESSLLTTYWSGSTDVLRHGTLNPLFQVALYLPS